MANNLVSIKNLTVSVSENNEEKKLLDGISLDVPENAIVGLVGGSGSGKTTTGLSLLRLLPSGLKILEGKIMLDDIDLLGYAESRMRKIRGKDVSMIFQEPLYAFNPVFSIGYQIDEVLKFHTDSYPAKRTERVYELLTTAGIDDPKRVARSYPYQLSGGMRQRAMIAQAIAANPRLLIADEPTSNLDVTLQAKMMELFEKLREKLKLSILLITHDLGMVSHISDQVVVMKQGQVIEAGRTVEVLENPQHEYTRELMEALCY